jgi:long-chain acyl-CoA synthetase
MEIIQKLLQQARANPERNILHGDSGEAWTYRDLCDRLLDVSTFLEQEEGRVGLLMQKTRPFTASFFGALTVGRVPVPLNYYLGSDALRYICDASNITTVIGDGSFPEKEEAIPMNVMDYAEVKEIPSGDRQGSSLSSLDELAEEVHDPFSVLLFTSGTTSNPKGVMLTEENIISNVKGSRAAMELRSDDHFLSSLPLFHSFGLSCGLLLPLLSGIPTTVESSFSPGRVLDTIPKQKVTVYLAVPSQYRAMAKRASRKLDLTPFHERHDSIRFISGGEPFPQPARKKIGQLLEQPVLEGYGLTETSPVVSVNELDEFKEGTTGRPLENLQVRIASPEDPESSRAPGKRGEIQVKGPSVMRGYLNADRDPFTSDGWFRTGDIGTLDEDGFLNVTGRLKDLIISSGENISPLRIKEYLLRQPEIEQAAVIGVADQKRGEVPAAFVTLKDGQDLDQEHLRRSIREQLGKLYVPSDVHVMEELPMGPTGKVLKRKLSEMASQDHS